MNRRLIQAGSIAAALTALCLSVPALADGHGHGGGNAFAGARGGYSTPHGAPAGGRVGVAPGRSAGFAGPRAMAPTARSAFAPAPGARLGYAPSRVYSAPRFNTAPAYRPSYHTFTARPGFNRPVHGVGFAGRPRYWAGGNFRGTYWPRSYYHSGFVRFVPILPAFYSTFWFAGVPYYYWDDTYYTWSPSEYGYVATDPPPAVADDSSESGSADVQSADTTSLYIYPKNGQSDEQTATDRYECHQWAASQTGFDPTNGANQSATSTGPADYRRAMMACLDARGYSAR